MAYTTVNFHATKGIRAEASHRGGTAWLEIYVDGLSVTIFFDDQNEIVSAAKIAQAINTIWHEAHPGQSPAAESTESTDA